MQNVNLVKIATLPSQLTGEGLEYLIHDDEVIAKFWNGNFMVTEIENGSNSEVTKKAA